MEIGNRFAFNIAYEEAIEFYEQSFEHAPKPRYIDMLSCIGFMQGLLGDKEAEVATQKRKLKLLKEEWHTTKGELVNEIKEKIAEYERSIYGENRNN